MWRAPIRSATNRPTTTASVLDRLRMNKAQPPLPADLMPARDCPLCPRLVAFRRQNQADYPDYFNGPVPSFGDADARLLIIGLAPGLKGANRTGRPFTGDYAGDLLYSTLAKFGFSTGTFAARADDGLILRGARIANAVRCVPPENKPTPAESKTCRPFLVREIEAMGQVKALLALGAVAHGSAVSTLGLKPSRVPFAHGAQHTLAGGRALFDSYHCSRYNTNTGRLTEAMFHAVFADIRRFLDA
jgi:uracil-DNA glycosylase family 4